MSDDGRTTSDSKTLTEAVEAGVRNALLDPKTHDHLRWVIAQGLETERAQASLRSVIFWAVFKASIVMAILSFALWLVVWALWLSQSPTVTK